VGLLRFKAIKNRAFETLLNVQLPTASSLIVNVTICLVGVLGTCLFMDGGGESMVIVSVNEFSRAI